MLCPSLKCEIWISQALIGGPDITSDVIMSWFRTFIVKSWILKTQYLVPTNVLDLLLLWATEISLPASGLRHKERNPPCPLTNMLCLTIAADNESFFSSFFYSLDIWGLKQLFILDQARLTQWRLSLLSILRSADWVLNWNSLAVWLLTITSFKKTKKTKIKAFFHTGIWSAWLFVDHFKCWIQNKDELCLAFREQPLALPSAFKLLFLVNF